MSCERSVVYYPEELSLLGYILDQAIESLPAAMQTPQNRTKIARNLLACAATGERDPIELELAARTHLKVSTVEHRSDERQNKSGIGRESQATKSENLPNPGHFREA
jgi:hypothetical protein